jgi:hypothetical protein
MEIKSFFIIFDFQCTTLLKLRTSAVQKPVEKFRVVGESVVWI